MDTTQEKPKAKPTKQEYFCAHCSYSTTNKPTLKVHVKFHSKRKPFTCNICSYKTVDKSNLKSHLKVHTGEKPHRCKKCDYRTTSKYYLKQHESIHSGDALFKCSYCSKSFRYRSTFCQHVRKHTGEIFKCKQCNYTTTEKRAMKNHVVTHSEERPFPCTRCSYRGKLKKMLRKHERNVHRKSPEVVDVDNHYVELEYSKEELPYDYHTYKNKDNFVFELETVPYDDVLFNCGDLVIKEERKDVLKYECDVTQNTTFVNGLPKPIVSIKRENCF